MAQDGAKQVGAMTGTTSSKTKKSSSDETASGKPSGAIL